METKTMKVSEETHSRLQALGQKGESFDTIIATLLDGNMIAGTARDMLRDPTYHRKMIVRNDLVGEGVDEVADFAMSDDSYKEFSAYWKTDGKPNRIVLLFADERRGAIIHSGSLVRPTGHKVKIEGVCRQRMYAAYFTEVLLPWVKKAVAPYTVEAKRVQYLGGVTAWGVVVVNAEEEAKDAKDGEA